jgi:FeS assembly SUF system protein
MTADKKTEIESKIVDVLRTVFDPEIPVNIYDLGLIYRIELDDEGNLDIDMTFTAPSCPMADYILEDVRTKTEAIEGVSTSNVHLVFEPEWNQSMMTEEARMELGFD